MLRRVARVMAVLMLFTGVAVAPSVATPAPAVANPCTGGGGADNEGNLGGGAQCPGEDGDDGSTGGGDGGGGGSRVCEYDGEEIPCKTDKGVFVDGCYRKLMDPQPPKDENIWNGKDEGYIVSCVPPYEQCTDDMPTEHMYVCAGGPIWQPEPPPTEVGPSPEELAERAYARMQLKIGTIGSTPPSTEVDGNAIGIVGMPIWLWVGEGDPDRNNGEFGHLEESETDGGLTVTVDARLDRVVWTLTDDDGGVYATTTCAGSSAPFTEWAGHGDARPSPTCGFDAAENRRSGNITVTATAYWTAEWAGGGLNGTIDVPPLPQEATLTIGEAQVLVQ